MILTTCKYFEGTGNFCSRVTAMRCDEFPECEFKYIAELKAENEKLRELLNHYQEEAEALRSYETYKIWLNNEYKKENDRLKEELTTYGATGVCEVCSDKANKLADKYLGCLQEIKEIADAKCNECKYDKDEISCKYGDCGEAKLHLIIQLITKAESEG